MAIKKAIMLMLSFVFISSLLMGCSLNKAELQEVKGFGLTYSEYFKTYDGLDERENVKYYKPVSFNDVESTLSKQIKKVQKQSIPIGCHLQLMMKKPIS